MRTRSGVTRRALKQGKPFRSPAEELVAALLRTADVVRGELERSLADLEVTGQQYNVLRILRGSHPESVATLEIAERMIERSPGITRMLDRLEAAGWVTRQRCSQDRRRVLCAITPAGLAALAKADGPVLEIEEQLARRLTRAEQATLTALLEQLQEESS